MFNISLIIWQISTTRPAHRFRTPALVSQQWGEFWELGFWQWLLYIDCTWMENCLNLLNSYTGQKRSYTARNLNQVCKVHSTGPILRLRSVLPHNYTLWIPDSGSSLYETGYARYDCLPIFMISGFGTSCPGMFIFYSSMTNTWYYTLNTSHSRNTKPPTHQFNSFIL